MQNTLFTELTHQCNRTDLAFFDLLRSIAEIHDVSDELSQEEINQLVIGVNILKGIISKSLTGPSLALISTQA